MRFGSFGNKFSKFNLRDLTTAEVKHFCQCNLLKKEEKEKKINKNSKITLHVLKVINEGLQTNN